MPQITQYTRQRLPTELINTQASARAFGGETAGLEAQARGMQQLSSALDQASQTALNIKLKYDESDALTKISDLELQAEKLKQDLLTEDFEPDTDLSEVYVERYRQLAESYDIPSSQRQRFQEYTAGRSVDFARFGLNEQARRVGVKARADWENTLTNLTNMVTLDPSAQNRAFEIGSAQIDARTDIPQADRDAIREGLKDALRGAAINTEAQKNPYRFIQDAKAGRYNDVENLARYMGIAEAEIKSIQSEQKKLASEAATYVQSAKDRLSQGYDLPQEEMLAIDQIVANYGDASAINELNILKNNKEIIKRFKKLTPLELNGIISQTLVPAIQNDGATENEIFLLEQAQKIQKNIIEETQRDPVGFVQRTSGNVKPIDFTNPVSIRNRVSKAKSLSENYNTPVKPLSSVELTSLMQDMNNAPISDQLSFIENLNSAGLENSLPVLNQIKESNPYIAQAAGLRAYVNNSENDAMAILRGGKSLQEDKNFRPLAQDVDLEVGKYLGNSLRMIPSSANQIKQAALAHYIGSGKYNGKDFDADDFRASINAVTGAEIAEYNNEKLLTPANTTAEDFEDFVELADDLIYENFSLGGVGPMTLSGLPVTAQDIRDYGTFETIGNGMYRVKYDGDYLIGGGPNQEYVIQIDDYTIRSLRQSRINQSNIKKLPKRDSAARIIFDLD